MWGVKRPKEKFSYWSLHSDKTGGVAILLDPDIAKEAIPWQESRWTQRVIAIEVNGQLLVNIYAPNKQEEREQFFADLRGWPWPHGKSVIAGGDFNCVMEPHLDRRGHVGSTKTESKELEAMILERRWTDARILVGGADEDCEVAPHNHFTYWTTRAASRIDRIYLSEELVEHFQWLEVKLPPVESDHQAVVLHLKETVRGTRKRHQHRVVYPIRSGNKKRVITEIQEELKDEGLGKGAVNKTWDEIVDICKKTIKRITKRLKQRRYWRMKARRKRERAVLGTRKALIAANSEDLQEYESMRIGKRLERTYESVRQRFKRVSVWERDQTVSEIKPNVVKEFNQGVNIADKFAVEWSDIQGRSHRIVTMESLEARLDQFVQIPSEQQVTEDNREKITRPMDEEEILAAIRSLKREKAAGPDGLNNDFFKDTQEVIAPVLVRVGNSLLRGEEPPSLFLEGLIIPLRKKGDSSNAMDYRPITLLQTSYKIVAKVLATRLQRFLGQLIGNSQQGFINGRQMNKTVMMMLAHLRAATEDNSKSMEESPGIFLLDFKKAYDTLDREFMFLVLEKFRFGRKFTHIIRKLHDGTTAKFVVNGEISAPCQIRSGIRQGCPLAPLLFILAAEVLGLAIKQTTDVQGIRVPGDSMERRHIFSAFVDDSTVFMQKAGQLPAVLQIVKEFGHLSGLHVQPAKSVFISLNTAVSGSELFHGIPVLQHGDTTRYLGYQVGTKDTRDVNWADRIRKIQRRLATACSLSTTVEDRVDILNSIVLPAITFTAAAFHLPKWAEKQLISIQKNFLWQSQTETRGGKHKMNPKLVFLPRKAGGIGLVSIVLALKVQRAKLTVRWLTQKADEYVYAWKFWVKQGRVATVSPREPSRGKRFKSSDYQLINEWLQPTKQQREERERFLEEHYESILEGCTGWWDSDERFTIKMNYGDIVHTFEFPEHIETYWGSFQWSNNPWILGSRQLTLKDRHFSAIRESTINDLQIQREGADQYSLRIQPTQHGPKRHRYDTMCKWAVAIILQSPREYMEGNYQKGYALRHSPTWLSNYTWSATAGGLQGTPPAHEEKGCMIKCVQTENGIEWTMSTTSSNDEDVQKLQKWAQTEGVVFKAHPMLHEFPWMVEDKVANRNVMKTLKRQAFGKYRDELSAGIAGILDKLEAAAKQDKWQRGLQQQTPKQLWRHDNALTSYQIWVMYRLALGQLNLYHEGRQQDNACRKTPTCLDRKETLSHIFWDCPCAKTCWKWLISKWTGHEDDSMDINMYRDYCAARKAPPGESMKGRLTQLSEKIQERRQGRTRETMENTGDGMLHHTMDPAQPSGF